MGAETEAPTAPAPVPVETATRLSGAARVRSGAAHHTAIVTGYETREIVVASGIQFLSADHRARMEGNGLTHDGLKRRDGLVSLVEGLESWVKGFHATSHTTGECLSRKQGVRFLLRYVETKSEFKTALETPRLHVIYNGHARFGRGPCFGPAGAPPGDWWEQGDTDTGIFRMGYPFIAVPASDISHHGYHARLAMAADGIPDVVDCEPELVPYRRRLTATRVADLGPEVAELLIDDEGNPLAGDAECLAYRRADEGQANARFVVLKAGWENTTSAPADLGATDIQCRVFCHFGCDTYQHNHAIVRERKGWRQEGDEGYAFFTSAVSYDQNVGPWLTGLMTYDKWNAFEPWKASLDYARRYCNAQIAARGGRWRIL